MKNKIREEWIKLGEIHAQIRKKIIAWIQEQGLEIKYVDICNFVYDTIREMKQSIAFPCGISKNDIAAHDTAFTNDTRTFDKTKDIVKIDWGIHQDGKIIDSAFTWIPSMCNKNETIREITDKELQAQKLTREVIDTMLKHIKIDVSTFEVAEKAQEIIDSYENVTCLNNLAGHQIEPWKIHGDYYIPFSVNSKTFFNGNPRFQKDDICAVEVFSVADTDPSIHMLELKDTNHFIWNRNNHTFNRLLDDTKKFKNDIVRKQDYRLPWTFKFQELKYTRCNEVMFISDLFLNTCIDAYPPIVTPTGANTFQYEDTIIIDERPINLTNVIYDSDLLFAL